jgi:hypothetical protein
MPLSYGMMRAECIVRTTDRLISSRHTYYFGDRPSERAAETGACETRWDGPIMEFARESMSAMDRRADRGLDFGVKDRIRNCTTYNSDKSSEGIKANNSDDRPKNICPNIVRGCKPSED